VRSTGALTARSANGVPTSAAACAEETGQGLIMQRNARPLPAVCGAGKPENNGGWIDIEKYISLCT
jgi:hypothetical protein